MMRWRAWICRILPNAEAPDADQNLCTPWQRDRKLPVNLSKRVIIYVLLWPEIWAKCHSSTNTIAGSCRMQNQEACGMHALRLSKQKPLQKSLYISYTFQNTWVPKNLSKILKESNMYCLYCQLNVLWYCLYVTYIILHNVKICPLPNAYSFLWGMSPSARLRRAPASLSASHRQKRWISIGQRKEKEESLNNVRYK